MVFDSTRQAAAPLGAADDCRLGGPGRAAVADDVAVRDTWNGRGGRGERA